jgi:glycosyltransferase involved in cell wall biosynthesis
MRVLVGMPWKLDWELSGFAKHIIACFKAISDLEIDVKLLCLGPSVNKPNFTISQIQVKTTPITDVFSPLVNSIAFSHKFSSSVTKENFDVLHCFNTTTFFLGDQKYVFQTANPTYAFALDAVRDEYPKIKRYQRLLKYYSAVAELERLEYEKADLIIAPSEVVKQNIRTYYQIERKKITVIPNGVSSEECNFDRPPRTSEGLKMVLYPGTMHIMKGFPYLVEAMRKVRQEFPETILLICGNFHPYEYGFLKELIDQKRKASGIVLAGFVPREKLFQYYHEADVCCLPLLYGTMSMAILEAVAHGLPIVTTEHSGFPDVEKVGIQIPPKDADAIASSILTLLSDSVLWKQKSENAKKVIQKYYWSIIAQQFLSIYNKL